jgi:hypothetical protein
MLNKTFSVRSNAIRNARSALGKAAQQGVHFTVSGEKGAYTWSPVDGAPEVRGGGFVDTNAPAVADEKPDNNKLAAAAQASGALKFGKTARKPRNHPAKSSRVKRSGKKVGRKQITSVAAVSGKRLKMFKLISSAKGASLRTLTTALGWQKHTVRGAISTIGSQFNVKVKSFKDERRGRVYKVA